MEQWKGRVAVVTAAGLGAGPAVVLALLDAGLIVVALVNEGEDLVEDDIGRLHVRCCDVSEDEETVAAFQWVDEVLGGVDLLVNNAQVVGKAALLDGAVSEWRYLLDMNVVALSLCTKEAVRSMRRRQVNGHIIHISSCTATVVPAQPSEHFYSATKHAVRALTEGVSHELRSLGSLINVTSISSGPLQTEGLQSQLGRGKTLLRPRDVTSAVLYVLSTPPRVQMQDVVLIPVGYES